MPDEFAELFAELRAETITRVRPPGVAAARRTVRRRRATGIVAVAAAVAVVAGGVVLAGGPTARRAAPTATQQSAGPSARVALAKQALGRFRTGSPLADATGVLAATARARSASVPAGAYLLVLACDGTGSILVEVLSGKRHLAGQTVRCGSPPVAEAVAVSVSPPAAGPLVISLEGSGAPPGTSAFALKLGADEESTNVPEPTEESAFNAGLAADALIADGAPQPQPVTTESYRQEQAVPVPKGQWSLSFACAGPGIITFTADTVPTGDGALAFQEELTCTDAGTARTYRLAADRKSTLTVTASPNEPARNHAGWAYSLRRR